MTRCTRLLLPTMLLLLAACDKQVTDADIKPVKIGELRALHVRQQERPASRTLLLIDPRSAARFEAAHIPGAMNLKLPQVPERGERDGRIDAYDQIVVYGDDPGSAAARAMTKRLLRIGYRNVRLFAGGLAEWMAAGYPVVRRTEEEPQAEPAPEPAAGGDEADGPAGE